MRQTPLAATQIQLVGGALMQLGPRKGRSVEPIREIAGFSDPSVFSASQQFQILRFFQDASSTSGLWMERHVLARNPNDRREYQQIEELSSSTFVMCGNQL